MIGPGIQTNIPKHELLRWRIGWAYRTAARELRRKLVYRPAARKGRR